MTGDGHVTRHFSSEVAIITRTAVESERSLAMPDRRDRAAAVSFVLSLVSLAIPALLWWAAETDVVIETPAWLLSLLLGVAVALAAVSTGVWSMGAASRVPNLGVLGAVLGALGGAASGLILLLGLLLLATGVAT